MNDNRIFLSTPGSGVSRAWPAANGRWQVETVLPGSRVACLAADPQRGGVVYAGVKEGGVLRSDDHGETWQEAGLPGRTVKALAVSPFDGGTVYAGCRPISMFVTRDGGRSWDELEAFRRIRRWWMFSPADPGDLRPYIQAIALSPSDPDVILAGIELGAVVRSQDGGRTWSGHLRGALRDCHSLKFHVRDGNWVYQAGGTGGGASVSSSSGVRWNKAKGGLAKHYGVACAADPARPDIWYASVAPSPGKSYGKKAEVYLYRSGKLSANGGLDGVSHAQDVPAWEPIGWQPHPLDEMPMALVTDPAASGHLYAGLAYGDVWQSTDYGQSWEKLPFNLRGVWSSLVILHE